MNSRPCSRSKNPPFALVIASLAAALVPAMLWGLFSGAVPLSPAAALEGFLFLTGRHTASNTEAAEIAAALIFRIRLPRLLLAAFVGASLGIAGAAFQGLFRNALADPYIIGASSGAALGAALAVSFAGGLGLGFFSVLGPPGFFAFAGSLAAVLLAFIISRSFGNAPSPATLILAGVSISAFCAALLALVLVVNDRNLIQVYFWLLGSLSGTTWPRLLSALPPMILGSVVIFLSSRPLDLLLQGDEAAESLGLNPLKTRFILALAATFPVASAVSVSGIIGFVGLIAPHGARFFTGPAHKRLLPASALAGALLAVLADNIARNIVPPIELPLGVITALGGAPFFLFLLVRRGRRSGGFV
ncbi:MAG: iron ABC transporter permease [Treponema sp.]|nr:iron ABC transporter permease [Treponema sp.]